MPSASRAAERRCVLIPRLLAARRFAQRAAEAFLHPLGVLLLLAIQWHGALRHLSGRPIAWKGRVQDDAREPMRPHDAARELDSHSVTGKIPR
jgi:hypothetical protein